MSIWQRTIYNATSCRRPPFSSVALFVYSDKRTYPSLRAKSALCLLGVTVMKPRKRTRPSVKYAALAFALMIQSSQSAIIQGTGVNTTLFDGNIIDNSWQIVAVPNAYIPVGDFR